MNPSKLNEWLTLLANLGVIAGILFLALEIQQNTAMTQAQTRDAMSEKLMEWYMNIGTSEYAADIFSKGRDEGVTEAGDISDQSAFRFMVFANIRMWENEYYQYQKGLFEEEEFNSSRQWPNIVSLPGYSELWEENKGSFSPDFVEFFEGNLR